MSWRRLSNFQIDRIIEGALREDMSSEDLTTNAIYRRGRRAQVSLIAKEEGVLAGLDVFKRTFTLMDEDMCFRDFRQEGEEVGRGDLVLEISGDVRTILQGERTALNFLQRMSGIATKTRSCVSALEGSRVKLLDTRKTTPNLRILEKYAVRVGGGENHRFGLSDGILIKDNHIGAAGSVTKAIELVREYLPFTKKIEIEVEDLEMVREALEAGADIIMLDNMSAEMIRQAAALIGKRALIECSGNIDPENIRLYRELEIDYISSGALTHHIDALDLSMKNLIYLEE